ncbi:MAG: trimethylamine methyltransferase family protein, partial [Desulfobacterales bacterium]|nr:trimethylamine methyltransferase family protein [Desulfobacterales bacterium]
MGTARPTALLDYVRFAKIVHQCGHFSVNGGLLVQPSDVPEQLSHLIMLYAALRASDKCLMATAYPEHRMEEIMEMAAILAGGKDVLERSHRILTLVSSTSPMGLDETAMGSILVSARYNQPLIISPGSAASSTSPIDLEKNVAFATAEALAAIVVAQMARSGIPVILSLQCFGADMKTANLPTGFSDCDLWAKYTAKLARKLNLPSSCGGSYTGAHSISPQKSYENMLTACENGVDLIVHAAGAMENHSTVSYEKWIMDVEIMEMVNNCLTDIEVRDITLNLDLGREVEPVRHFLASSTSLNKCRNIAWTTGNGGNGNIDRGMALDLCYRSISTQLRQMLMEYRPPDLDADVLKRLNRFMS